MYAKQLAQCQACAAHKFPVPTQLDHGIQCHGVTYVNVQSLLFGGYLLY